ncbi:hypothetical protein [Kitasatospora camelliae]|uniref:Uncharacterized protein n=1 Tax=Kitasatospora camelliae TaxID=3156397 RepID=A0AAU8K4V0_9ACTN
MEQRDPEDAANIAFGSTRTAPATVVCDGTERPLSVVVQSKTGNWIPGVPAVLATTVTNIGASPSAAADARKLPLDVGPLTVPAPSPSASPQPNTEPGTDTGTEPDTDTGSDTGSDTGTEPDADTGSDTDTTPSDVVSPTADSSQLP